jgi:hypothetical protein
MTLRENGYERIETDEICEICGTYQAEIKVLRTDRGVSGDYYVACPCCAEAELTAAKIPHETLYS